VRGAVGWGKRGEQAVVTHAKPRRARVVCAWREPFAMAALYPR
jgi:hypothetical protein